MNKTLLTLCSVATAATCVMVPKSAEAHHGCGWVGFGIGAAVGGIVGLCARPVYSYGYVMPATVVPATPIIQQPVVQQQPIVVQAPAPAQPKFPELKPGQTLTVQKDGSYVISYQQPVTTNVLSNANVNVR